MIKQQEMKVEWAALKRSIEENHVTPSFASQSTPVSCLYPPRPRSPTPTHPDSYNSGKSCGFDPHRLMTNCRVVEGVLCFQDKEVYNIYELFRTRCIAYAVVAKGRQKRGGGGG